MVGGTNAFSRAFVVHFNLLCLLQSSVSTFFVAFFKHTNRHESKKVQSRLVFCNKLSWPLSKLEACNLIRIFLFAMTVVMNYQGANLHANYAVFGVYAEPKVSFRQFQRIAFLMLLNLNVRFFVTKYYYQELQL